MIENEQSEKEALKDLEVLESIEQPDTM